MTTVHDDHGLDPTPAVEVGDESPNSTILDNIRRRRAEAASNKGPLDLNVPGQEGELFIRYKFVPYKEMRKTAEAVLKSARPGAERDMKAAADTLILCCEEIMIRVGDNERPLGTEDDPITFNEVPRLSEALGFEPVPAMHSEDKMPARSAVFATFGDNEYAVFDHAERVSRWLKDTTQTADEELLGGL